jgi:hypothetical protein
LRIYGYYEFKLAVERVPGFTFQWDIENYPVDGVWPPEIDFIIGTDQSGVQHLAIYINSNLGTYTTDSNSGFDARQAHVYGLDWQQDHITCYVDDVQVLRIVTPSGTYTNYRQYMFLLTASNYAFNQGDPNPASLPAYARLDYVRVWVTKPGGSGGPPPTGTTSPDNTFISTVGPTIYDSEVPPKAWTLVNGSNGVMVAVNGVTDQTTANVAQLGRLGGRMHQQNAAGNWWWSPEAAPPVWTAEGDPRPGGGGGGGGGGGLTQPQLDALASAISSTSWSQVPGGECFSGTCYEISFLVGDVTIANAPNVQLSGDVGSFTDNAGNTWTLTAGLSADGNPPAWWWGGPKLNGGQLWNGYNCGLRRMSSGHVWIQESKHGGWWDLTAWNAAGRSGRPGLGQFPT